MRKFALLVIFLLPLMAIAKSPAAGRIENFGFNSKIFNNQRYIRVWLPAIYDDPAHKDDRFPVLYLNDGQFAYHATFVKGMRGDWHADEAAAKLIAEDKIEPIIIVAIDNGGRDGRSREYLPVLDTTYKPAMTDAVGDRFPDVVFDEIVPFINSRFRTRTGAEDMAIGGSSFGAVAALYCAMARPGKVGKLLLESPSLYVGDGWLFKKADGITAWPVKIVLGVGTNEVPNNPTYSREAVNDVTRFDKMLKKAGVEKNRVKVVIEEGATHNEDAWAGRFPAALKFLFGKDKNKN